jgi:dihydroorotase
MAGVVKNLPHTLSKFLNLGMDLGSVIACATANPARLLGLEGKIGTLHQGAVADVALFEVESGDFQFEDAQGKQLSGKLRLAPRGTIRAGKVSWTVQ